MDGRKTDESIVAAQDALRHGAISRRNFLRLATGLGLTLASAEVLAACATPATAVPPTAVPPTAVPPTAAPVATKAVVAATAAPTAVPATAVPATKAPTAAPTAAAKAAAKVLNIREAGDLAGVDPAFMVGLTDSLVSDCVLSGLVRQKINSYDWELDLCESLKQSADGLTVDFKLRQGVKWQRGYGEVTTDDVKYSFERMIDKKLAAAYASDWATLDHVEAVDKYTGKIIFSKPFAPLFNSTLPVNSGKIVCKKYVEEVGKDKFTLDPVGCGAYILDKWTPKTSIILKRNPDYFGPAPYYDEIDVFPIADPQAAEVALDAGAVDHSMIQLADAARYMANPKYKSSKWNALTYAWIGMCMENPKLTDIRVRQAIRYGIDVPSILAATTFGQATPCYGLIPPGIIGYWKDAPKYVRDVAKAKDYLKQAGVTNLELTYSCSNTGPAKTQAEVVQANLQEVGIKITINALDSSAYWQIGMGDKGKDINLYGTQFSMYPDPSWASAWFTIDQVGVWNWMRWKSPEFDALHLAGQTELDLTKRADIYIQMQKLWDAACHSVWLNNGTYVFSALPKIKGAYTPNGQEQFWNFGANA